uniref:Putative secreted protein n=1 Tax=Ixodes ricinus TaxID=34613 RepID=A0A6B0USQ0_IXORI
MASRSLSAIFTVSTVFFAARPTSSLPPSLGMTVSSKLELASNSASRSFSRSSSSTRGSSVFSHSLRDRSCDAVAKNLPLGLIPKAQTSPWCPSRVTTFWKLSASHCLMLASLLPVKNMCVLGRNCRHMILSSWARIDR